MWAVTTGTVPLGLSLGLGLGLGITAGQVA